MRFMQRLCLCALSMALSACYFEADKDFYAGQASLSLDSFAGANDRIILRKAVPTVEYIVLATLDDGLFVSLTDENLDSSGIYTKAKLIADPALPSGIYVLDAPLNAVTTHYFSFAKLNETDYAWLAPESSTKVANSAALHVAISAVVADTSKWKRFSVLAGAEGDRAWATFVKKFQEKKENNTKTQASTASNKPAAKSTPRTTGPVGLRLEDLDVGEGVYVQGVFSDELVRIARIDLDARRIKVLRSSDGTGMWVAESNILSRAQSRANDIGRAAIGIGIVVCMFNPDACK